MKKILFSTLIIFASLFFLNIHPVHAQMGSMPASSETEESTHDVESVEVVLQELLDKQNVTTVQELNLSRISDDEWERLGDAVMELQHPGQAHEAMDRMMGGKGSETLRQMHINMGQAYLAYSTDNNPYRSGMMMGGGMMRGGMMGNGTTGVNSMMNYGFYRGYGVLTALVWILAIAFFTSGTYFFLRKANKK